MYQLGPAAKEFAEWQISQSIEVKGRFIRLDHVQQCRIRQLGKVQTDGHYAMLR